MSAKVTFILPQGNEKRSSGIDAEDHLPKCSYLLFLPLQALMGYFFLSLIYVLYLAKDLWYFIIKDMMREKHEPLTKLKEPNFYNEEKKEIFAEKI